MTAITELLGDDDHRGYKKSCGTVTPQIVQAAANASPRVAIMMEAVMIAGLQVRDKDGKIDPVIVPPTLALAIIHILASADPLRTVSEIAAPRS